MSEQELFNKLKLYLEQKKPIYIHGKSGIGKTYLIKKLEPLIKFIAIHDINDYDDLAPLMEPSILDIFNRDISKKICVIDDIDFLHTHEKKVITSLMKNFKLEDKGKRKRSFPIILCGTNTHDKKIKELQKLCNVIHYIKPFIIKHNLYEKNIQNNIRQIMQKEFKGDFMIENEKATQALLFHENIIDLLKTDQHLGFYYNFLKNFCIGDYFDRISFQKQLWIFNEMTYYIKILHNYYLYQKMDLYPRKTEDYRFTKVLTKYSNEYNNNTFIIGLCSRLNCTKKELYKKILLEDTKELTPIELNRVSIFFQLKD
jgi:chromosomal replication initiation ATPase DnaA